MASLPPPLWSGGIVATAQSLTAPFFPPNPTQDEYLTLLRHECRRRGLVDWKEELTDADILAAFPFKTYMNSQPPHHTWLTKEQWADATDSINDFEFQKIDREQQALEQEDRQDEQTKQDNEWNTQRRTFLETYAPLYLPAITANTKRDYVAAGGTQQRLDSIAQTHPANTILYWLAELWNLQAQLKTEKDPKKKERFLSTRVFCDILQESCRVVDCRIRYSETWAGFTSTMQQQLLVRYLVTKHNPAIAETLFADDDTIWPPEGVLPLRNEDDSLVSPEQYTRRADLVYDNGPGRGWWCLVHPKQGPEGLLNVRTGWKAIDDVEDWDSLMKWLNEHREATVAFRHQSTKERMEFVARKREEEETVLGFPGYRPFNFYLDRHWDMVEDKTQLYGPLREESNLWEELDMEVSEGSGRLQSAASKEIDAKLKEWGITKDASVEEYKGQRKGVDCPSTKPN
jgi:hypothetical protein